MFDNTDQLAVNTIRTLSIDAIEKANSGHPRFTNGSSSKCLYSLDRMDES